MFLSILEYIYTDNLDLERYDFSFDARINYFIKLKKFAEKYFLPRLVSICDKQLHPDLELSPSTLRNDLELAIYSEKYSDITFRVEDSNESINVSAHKCILTIRSSYFEKMFHTGLKESTESLISLFETSKDVLESIFKFLYCEKIEIEPSLGLQVLEIANLLGLDQFKLLVEKQLKEFLDVDNVCIVYQMAELLNCFQLKADCVQFIKSNFEFVSNLEIISESIEKDDSELKLQLRNKLQHIRKDTLEESMD